MKIYHLQLEPYKERYTELLANWSRIAFEKHGLDYVSIEGELLEGGVIKTGCVLDAHGRSHYALTQMANLVKLLKETDTTTDDVIYVEDMFNPGYSALPYIFDQMPEETRPRIFSRNFAQSTDVDDFVFPMRRWMRNYELMVSATSTIFVANRILKEACEIAMFPGKVITVGLPFNKHTVREIAGDLVPWDKRSDSVIYSSRWEKEKQPWLFLDIVEKLSPLGVSFSVCTGGKALKGHQPSVDRAEALSELGKLTIHTDCSKQKYYSVLKNSKVQFNCARQDFVSNTLLEASALCVKSVVPCFRSFPEVMYNQPEGMYAPFNIGDAIAKINAALNSDLDLELVSTPANDHSETIDRICEVFKDVK